MAPPISMINPFLEVKWQKMYILFFTGLVCKINGLRSENNYFSKRLFSCLRWDSILGENAHTYMFDERKCNSEWQLRLTLKSVNKTKFFITGILCERAFKMIKIGVYFIVKALLVAELFKILKALLNKIIILFHRLVTHV